MLLNGLYDAKCDQHPVLAITGHTFHDLIGMDYQQDVDLDKLYMDVSVFNERVMGAAHAVNVVDMAVRTAYGRRGVSHICIPKISRNGQSPRSTAAAAMSHTTAATGAFPPPQSPRRRFFKRPRTSSTQDPT